MKKIFNDTEYEDKSIEHNKSTRHFEIKSWELWLIFYEIGKLTPKLISYKNNFTKEEYYTPSYLRGNQDIVFKTADKRSRSVVSNKKYYRDRIEKQEQGNTNLY